MPICQKFLWVLPSEYIPNPATSDQPHCFSLAGAPRISHLDTHLPAVLSAFTLGSSPGASSADPLIPLKSKMHVLKSSKFHHASPGLKHCISLEVKLRSSQWPAAWLSLLQSHTASCSFWALHWLFLGLGCSPPSNGRAESLTCFKCQLSPSQWELPIPLESPLPCSIVFSYNTSPTTILNYLFITVIDNSVSLL